MEIRPYEETFRDGVLACIKRNYPNMATWSDDRLYDWLSPMLSYRWQEDISSSDYPFKRGMVMIGDGKVVGFFGLILSRRYGEDSVPYLLQSGTTWCIDGAYRKYLLSAMKKIYSGDDRVFYEVTAIQAMEELYISVYKFRIVEDESLRFFPMPYTGKQKICTRFIESPGEIEDKILKKEYEDHIPYGVKALFFETERKVEGIVFYKVVRDHGNWVRILKIVSGDIFAEYAHELIWNIQQRESYSDAGDTEQILYEILKKQRAKEWIALECDRFFFEGHEPRHPIYDKKRSVRLMLNKNKNQQPVKDILYTELALMDFG